MGCNQRLGWQATVVELLINRYLLGVEHDALRGEDEEKYNRIRVAAGYSCA